MKRRIDHNIYAMPEERTTDYLIIGAGAMGMAFVDELLSLKPDAHITIVERRDKPGGHWNNAYPFVGLHQPAAFYGVNSMELGNGSADLSSKPEILAYYDRVIDRFERSGQVVFLSRHEYLGEGKVRALDHPEKELDFQVNKCIVDATYMKVEVPSTHPPKYQVDPGVALVPINALVNEHDQWDRFYVVGSGKTGMDAVLYLLEQQVDPDRIHWIVPNDAWLFNRSKLQVGMVAAEIMRHAKTVTTASNVDDIFLELEQSGGILRLDSSILPTKWRCATVSPEELEQLKRIQHIIRKGRVKRIHSAAIEFQEGEVPYPEGSLFVDCSADGLAKKPARPIFTKGLITLQPILFCQQVFSAALIARVALMKRSDAQKNRLIPVPHPEFKEDWPSSLSVSIRNLIWAHFRFPIWMFRARLNFMSHEPIFQYFYYAGKAMALSPAIQKGAKKLNQLQDV
ncbi:MAG: NAD(P)/FAD-dependent oxidoreductase [Bacteroidota bacterium]